MDTPLLSSAYMPSLSYFTVIVAHEWVLIEKHENYIKQTYRNRCRIAGANGIQVLSVPVLRGSFHKTPFSSLEIDYSRRWINVHTGAITSAYKNSPFFQFYADDILGIISERHRLLIDLNMKLTTHICSLLGIRTAFSFTESYVREGKTRHDLRYAFSPKKRDPLEESMKKKPYMQVFSEKHGFIPDLSIIDLLFNMGPGAISWLNNARSI